VATYSVGRLKYFLIWPHHGNRTWDRTRWWPTRRNLLHVKGLYNRKTAIPEKKILDRRPIYWVLSLVLLAMGPLLFPQVQMNTLLTAGATFGFSRRLMSAGRLLFGRVNFFPLATYAVVGTAAFVTSLLSIRLGLAVVCIASDWSRHRLAFGVLIAAPALRLDGFNYALLTLGLNELFRVFFTLKQFGRLGRALWS